MILFFIISRAALFFSAIFDRLLTQFDTNDQNRPILNVGVFTDDNPVVVTPDSHVIPDGGVSFNDDVADDGGVFCNESSRMNLRRMLAQSINSHMKVCSES